MRRLGDTSACVTAVAAVAAAAALGCQVSSPEAGTRVGARTDWIVDGTPTDGEELAVVVVFNRIGARCTGTLISSRVVLTAKHCVQAPGASEPSPPAYFVVGIGDSVDDLSEQYLVQSVETTAGVYTSGSESLSGELLGKDVAVVTLSGTSSVEPVPIRREDPEELLDEEVEAVGYGDTPEGMSGTKLRATTRVTGFRDTDDGGVIFTPAVVCEGDSGGPLFSSEGEVIGVASFGTGPCGAGSNGYNRIDRFLPMIDGAIGDAGGCLDDGAEVCDGYDNDCNGEIDEVCSDIGDSCAVDEDCVGGGQGGVECLATDAGRLCTHGCDPLRPLLGCPSGMYCGKVDDCSGRCLPGAAGALEHAEPCTADTDCASLYCADPGDGLRRCLVPCRYDAGTCLADEACAAAPESCGGCVPAGDLAGPRGLGEPCGMDADCRDGLCFTDRGLAPEASYCSRSCGRDSDCASSFHCRVLGGAGGSTGSDGVCIRGPRPGVGPGFAGPSVGPGCFFNEDCGLGGFCATRADVHWCTTFCEHASQCPEGYGCLEVGEVRVCAPEAGILGAECERDAECMSGLCLEHDQGRRCGRFCGPESPCPTGFECRRDAESQRALCLAAPRPGEAPPVGRSGGGGGCAVSPQAGESWPWLSWLGVLLGLGARRRWRQCDAF